MKTTGFVFYTIATNLYFGLLKLIAPFNAKARLFVSGRKNLLQQIENALQNEKRERIWFHCASLGEFEQARPLIEALRKRENNKAFVLTFFSPSGYEVRKNTNVVDYVFYLPNDSKRNAKKFLQLVKPTLAVFTKYEFWFHYLNELKQSNTHTLLISARFRASQIFFKWYGAFYKNILKCFTHIFTQDENSVELLKQIGITNATKAGDTRFDRVAQTAAEAKQIPAIAEFKNNSLLIVAGSSYETEENFLASALQELSNNLKVIIAPHEIAESRLQQIEKTFSQFGTIRFSQFNSQTDAKVLIIDNVGMLAAIYGYADIAIVGGGFGTKGLHNILEPATFGIPVLYGFKNHEKFPEATELAKAGGGFIFSTSEKLKNQLLGFISQPNQFSEAEKKSKEFIRNNTSAIPVILTFIPKLLK